MRAYLVLAPNLLSGTRLALIPVLWALALRGDTWAVGIGLVAAGITDVLDGHLARRLNATTAAGAALDSLADNLLIPSGVAWL
ncbi:MAG: CDP-alcohol phosphatidyltransferase family protein, partial [Gammaproteobacteria bacterium]|nr:CDP-alcohol phosphatidyltransferase family protein [Gemmatimonadota bacterium]NIU78676.1 CDP-alcohol phosphatidyltransferase family protein [Gammaproteobacteria bacterium]NIY11880.1 CDP-alcohol phosphatidyltransferase family protein [Gemmatimonadota bacterium]